MRRNVWSGCGFRGPIPIPRCPMRFSSTTVTPSTAATTWRGPAVPPAAAACACIRAMPHCCSRWWSRRGPATRPSSSEAMPAVRLCGITMTARCGRRSGMTTWVPARIHRRGRCRRHAAIPAVIPRGPARIRRRGRTRDLTATGVRLRPAFRRRRITAATLMPVDGAIPMVPASRLTMPIPTGTDAVRRVVPICRRIMRRQIATPMAGAALRPILHPILLPILLLAVTATGEAATRAVRGGRLPTRLMAMGTARHGSAAIGRRRRATTRQTGDRRPVPTARRRRKCRHGAAPAEPR